MVLQDLPPGQLLGTYNGEVCLQSEYNESRDYDLTRGDNLRDDKTKDLYTDDSRPPFIGAFVKTSCSIVQASTGKCLSSGCTPSRHHDRLLQLLCRWWQSCEGAPCGQQ